MHEIKVAIEKLFADPKVTNYQISKTTGISQVSLSKFAKGESSIDNMPLGNALKLYDYYKKMEGEGKVNNDKRDLLFGRLLGVCNILGERLFEKGKPSIDEKTFKKFPNAPVSTFEMMHKDIMQYTHKFGKEENYLLSLFDEILAQMNESDFNGEPLGNKYLLGYSKQKHELKDYRIKGD
ncbi:hypothetical protein BKM15_26030 [Pseudomonas syringae pv. syringae]|nr:hypothetical protein BKM15_26030 [Pseudomonas syringae pv. syringae]